MFHSWHKSLAHVLGISNCDARPPTDKKRCADTMLAPWNQWESPKTQFWNKSNFCNNSYFAGIKNVGVCSPLRNSFTTPINSNVEDKFFDAKSLDSRKTEHYDFGVEQKKHISINTNKISTPGLLKLSWANLLRLHTGRLAKVNEMSEDGDKESSNTNPLMHHRNLWQFSDDFGNNAPIAVSFDSYIDGSTSQLETWVRIENDDSSSSGILKDASTSEILKKILNYNNKEDHKGKLMYSSNVWDTLGPKAEQISDDSQSSIILPEIIQQFCTEERLREVSVQCEMMFANKDTECESLASTETESRSICTQDESRLFSNHMNTYDYSPDLSSTPYDTDDARSEGNDEISNWKTIHQRDRSNSPSITDELNYLIKSTIDKAIRKLHCVSCTENLKDIDVMITYKTNYKCDISSENAIKSRIYTSEDTLKNENFNLNIDVNTNLHNVATPTQNFNSSFNYIVQNLSKNILLVCCQNGNTVMLGVDQLTNENEIDQTYSLDCGWKLRLESRLIKNNYLNEFRRCNSDYTFKFSESDAALGKQNDEMFGNRFTNNFIFGQKLSVLQLEKHKDKKIEINDTIDIKSVKNYLTSSLLKTHECTSSANSTKQIKDSSVTSLVKSPCVSNWKKEIRFGQGEKSDVTLYESQSINTIDEQKSEISRYFEDNQPSLLYTKTNLLSERVLHSVSACCIHEESQNKSDSSSVNIPIYTNVTSIINKIDDNIVEKDEKRIHSYVEMHTEFTKKNEHIRKYEDIVDNEDCDIIIEENEDDKSIKIDENELNAFKNNMHPRTPPDVTLRPELSSKECAMKNLVSDGVKSNFKKSLNVKTEDKLTNNTQGKKFRKKTNNHWKRFSHNSRLDIHNKSTLQLKENPAVVRKDYSYVASPVMTRTGLLSSQPVSVRARVYRRPYCSPARRRFFKKF